MSKCRMLSEKCLCVQCGLQGTEQCASEAKVEQRADNTGSPKLPLDELKRYLSLYCKSGEGDYDTEAGACDFVGFVERQHRADA